MNPRPLPIPLWKKNAKLWVPVVVALIVVIGESLIFGRHGRLYFPESATAQSVPAQAPLNGSSPAKKPPPATSGGYQNYFYGGNNNIFEGPVTVNINPPADANGLTVYSFDGHETEISGGHTNMNDEFTGTFMQLSALADGGHWKEVTGKADEAIKNTEGKWIGAYAFKALAMTNLGKEDDGMSMLTKVRDLLIKRPVDERHDYNVVVRKYLPEKLQPDSNRKGGDSKDCKKNVTR